MANADRNIHPKLEMSMGELIVLRLSPFKNLIFFRIQKEHFCSSSLSIQQSRLMGLLGSLSAT